MNKLIDAKANGNLVIPTAKPRNFVAKNAKTSGAGSHATKKFTRKEKHKKLSETP